MWTTFKSEERGFPPINVGRAFFSLHSCCVRSTCSWTNTPNLTGVLKKCLFHRFLFTKDSSFFSSISTCKSLSLFVLAFFLQFLCDWYITSMRLLCVRLRTSFIQIIVIFNAQILLKNKCFIAKIQPKEIENDVEIKACAQILEIHFSNGVTFFQCIAISSGTKGKNPFELLSSLLQTHASMSLNACNL